jgi:hypothetical protein
MQDGSPFSAFARAPSMTGSAISAPPAAARPTTPAPASSGCCTAGKRCIIPDPLGVWWGLRLDADGKSQSGFDVVIFGGPHGDLPLTEHVGALIGETVAGMKESCILDLSELGTKAAERRFMLAFLTALYKHASGEPLHVVFDEADMWAPQKLLDKEGDAAKLLGMMETIVRRGRVKGFIPWLISQRPAVLSKDVLSQVDGLVAFKLTSVAGPRRDRRLGEGPGRHRPVERNLEIAADAGARPRRRLAAGARHAQDGALPGEGDLRQLAHAQARREGKAQAKLKPLNLDKLRDRLATVEAETKANDPKALKAEIATPKLKKHSSGKKEVAAAADGKGKNNRTH